MGMAFKMVSMRLVVCYLGLSWFLLTAAVPATRSLRTSNEIVTLPAELVSLPLDVVKLMEGGRTYQVKRRMNIEINDYADPGANPRHEPPPMAAKNNP